MMHPTFVRKVVICALLALLLGVSASASSIRVRGSMGAKSYGYQDAEGIDHQWLAGITNISAYNLYGPVSAHTTIGWFGDSVDDYGTSAQFRYLKGYLQYRMPKGLTMRAGRFFLYRGVGLGVLDGIDVSMQLNKKAQLAVYGGGMGALSRDFEFDALSKTNGFGGEFKYSLNDKHSHIKNTVGISYTRQVRNEEVYRHRLGLSGYTRVGSDITWLNIAQLRMESIAFRRFTSRFRYKCDRIAALAEFSMFTPDMADHSWFSDFELGTAKRIRLGADYYFIEREWGVGLDAQVYMSGETGIKAGPVVTTPYGQIGYHLDAGDYARSGGPWASLNYSPMSGINLYAYGSFITFEWEAMQIEATEDVENNLMMAHAGVKYRPASHKNFGIKAEFQMYSSPALEQDRRVIGGLTWNFDTARGK